MLWQKQDIVLDKLPSLEEIYDKEDNSIPNPEEISVISIDGKKGLWTLDEIINLLRKNEIRFKIVL